MALEKTIQANILKYLNSLEGCVAENVLGCAAQKDRPDINCCYNGTTYRIEVKSPDNGNTPTKGQILNLKKWAKAGAKCYVVWSLDDVKAIMSPRYLTFLNTDYPLELEGFCGWVINSDGTITKFNKYRRH